MPVFGASEPAFTPGAHASTWRTAGKMDTLSQPDSGRHALRWRRLRLHHNTAPGPYHGLVAHSVRHQRAKPGWCATTHPTLIRQAICSCCHRAAPPSGQTTGLLRACRPAAHRVARGHDTRLITRRRWHRCTLISGHARGVNMAAPDDRATLPRCMLELRFAARGATIDASSLAQEVARPRPRSRPSSTAWATSCSWSASAEHVQSVPESSSSWLSALNALSSAWPDSRPAALDRARAG